VALFVERHVARAGALLRAWLETSMANLVRLLEQIDRVPPMSAAAQHLLRLQSRPDHSLVEFAKVVEVDPGLTLAVLRASNSAAARPAQPIQSVRQAVTYVGERTVVALALSACVPGGMTAPMEAYQSDRGVLWRHSLRSAVAARDLALHIKRHKIDPDLAFTAALLHDIGKPLLAESLDEGARTRLIAAAVRKDENLEAVERAEAGLCHAEVGEALARRWNLSAPLQVALRFHHQPSQAPEAHRPLAFVVHVAAMHAALTGFAAGLDDQCYRLDMGMLTIFDLSEVDFSAMLQRVDRECADVLARVGEP
jgi:putative nucleotidyltransferase with HDIG domain